MDGVKVHGGVLTLPCFLQQGGSGGRCLEPLNAQRRPNRENAPGCERVATRPCRRPMSWKVSTGRGSGRDSPFYASRLCSQHSDDGFSASNGCAITLLGTETRTTLPLVAPTLGPRSREAMMAGSTIET